MDKLTVIKVLDIINEHIRELERLPGNPIGKEPTIAELRLVASELKAEIGK